MPYTIDQDLFLIEEKERIKKYYNANKSKLIGFEDRQSLINRYMHELYINENKCHYCETSILIHLRVWMSVKQLRLLKKMLLAFMITKIVF